MTDSATAAPPKIKKSVALSGTVAGNTALCTVGRSGNDLHYRGYDILDIADTCEFEEVAHLLIHGKLPTKITGDIKEEYGFLRSISHLGISLNSRDEVDHIAAMAKEDGCLLLGPMYRNEVVGYICVVTDPDGNNLEFSVEQDLG